MGKVSGMKWTNEYIYPAAQELMFTLASRTNTIENLPPLNPIGSRWQTSHQFLKQNWLLGVKICDARAGLNRFNHFGDRFLWAGWQLV